VTKLAELPIPANHRYGAGLGWSEEVRQMSAIGTERNCLGAHGHFRSWGHTGRTINLATTAALAE